MKKYKIKNGTTFLQAEEIIWEWEIFTINWYFEWTEEFYLCKQVDEVLQDLWIEITIKQ